MNKNKNKYSTAFFAAIIAFLFVAMYVAPAFCYLEKFVAPGQNFSRSTSEVLVSSNTPTVIAATDTSRVELWISNVSTRAAVQIVIATSAANCAVGAIAGTAGPNAWLLDVATSTVIGVQGIPKSGYHDGFPLIYVGPWFALTVSTVSGSGGDGQEFSGKVKVTKEQAE